MAAKHQKQIIRIPKEYGAKDRTAIGLDILERIRDRTQSENEDKKGSRFPGYTKEYTRSLDYRNAGKTGAVNLTLSGDMLAAMRILEHKDGAIIIGFKDGTKENARADGNIRGTYGQSKPNPGKARDFLGISNDELQEILDRYETEEQAEKRIKAEREAKLIAKTREQKK